MNIDLSMVQRAALQEHPEYWCLPEEPDCVVGEVIRFYCHQMLVCTGRITAINPPAQDGVADLTGPKIVRQEIGWWKICFEPQELKMSGVEEICEPILLNDKHKE